MSTTALTGGNSPFCSNRRRSASAEHGVRCGFAPNALYASRQAMRWASPQGGEASAGSAALGELLGALRPPRTMTLSATKSGRSRQISPLTRGKNGSIASGGLTMVNILLPDEIDVFVARMRGVPRKSRLISDLI